MKEAEGMYYTPKRVLRVIDSAAGSGGYLLTVATGSGKSKDLLEMVNRGATAEHVAKKTKETTR